MTDASNGRGRRTGKPSGTRSVHIAAAKAKLGSGDRFKAVEANAAAHGAEDPGAVAYEAGVKAHGAAEMAALSAAGRKRAAAKRKG